MTPSQLLVVALAAAHQAAALHLHQAPPPPAPMAAGSVAGSAVGSGANPLANVIACPPCVCAAGPKIAHPMMTSPVLAKHGCPPCPCVGNLYKPNIKPPTKAEEITNQVPGISADAHIHNVKATDAVLKMEKKLEVLKSGKDVPFGVRKKAINAAHAVLHDAVESTVAKVMAPIKCKYLNKDCNLAQPGDQQPPAAGAAPVNTELEAAAPAAAPAPAPAAPPVAAAPMVAGSVAGSAVPMLAGSVAGSAVPMVAGSVAGSGAVVPMVAGSVAGSAVGSVAAVAA